MVERTLASFEIFTLVGVLYFIVCYVGSWASRRLEARLSQAGAGGPRPPAYVFGAG